MWPACGQSIWPVGQSTARRLLALWEKPVSATTQGPVGGGLLDIWIVENVIFSWTSPFLFGTMGTVPVWRSRGRSDQGRLGERTHVTSSLASMALQLAIWSSSARGHIHPSWSSPPLLVDASTQGGSTRHLRRRTGHQPLVMARRNPESLQRALESRIQTSMVMGKRAVKQGRTIKPGSKAEVRWDALEANEVLSGQHNWDDVNAAQQLARSLPLLARLEEDGRYSKARKIRKEINLQEDARWAVRSSWCPTCLNVFHNCKCQPPEMPNKVSMEFMDDFNARRNREIEEGRRAKKEEAKRLRKERRRK